MCPTSMYWSTSTCLAKKTYKEACTASILCQDYKGLLCHSFNSTCLCPPTKYWVNSDLLEIDTRVFKL